MQLIFLDTETTGLTQDKDARLCQLAYKVGDETVNELYKPSCPIGLGAMAVNHITEAMVKDKPAFKGSPLHGTLAKLVSKKTNIVIAHNASFDIEMLKRDEIEPKAYICSLVVAQHFCKGMAGLQNFKLQTLRYFFGVELADSKAHDAQGDVEVLEQVFYKLFEIAEKQVADWAKAKGKKSWTKNQILERMVEMSMSPTESINVFTFGKHQGEQLTDVIRNDRHYCEWLVDNAKDPGDRVIVALKSLLNK
jgi:exodeoxyribonuclease X